MRSVTEKARKLASVPLRNAARPARAKSRKPEIDVDTPDRSIAERPIVPPPTFSRPSLPPQAFAKPFRPIPVSRRFYVGDQHGAAVEFQGVGRDGSCPTYATREEAEMRIREIMDEKGEE